MAALREMFPDGTAPDVCIEAGMLPPAHADVASRRCRRCCLALAAPSGTPSSPLP